MAEILTDIEIVENIDNLKDFYIENKNHEVKETPVVVTTLTTNTDKAVTQD